MKNDEYEKHASPELVDAKAAARIAGVSTDTLRRLVREGGAPAPVRVRRSVRWRIREVLQWIDAGCPPCVPEPPLALRSGKEVASDAR
jgi:predicted DNA-binding transcriptional regulator AlpA